VERKTVVGPALGRARRSVLRRILASGLFALAAAPALLLAQAPKAKATAPGSGRSPLYRRDELPRASDLAADASASRRGRLPILLFFDRDECPYCEQALREYLVPLSREEWQGRALFRQVGIDRRDPVVDFAGTRTTHAALAARYGVFLSPTVIVVDGDGRPIGEPIVGLLTVDFYGAYIDGALETARRKLARP
jgi:thioredoxin-related protein